MVEVRITGWSKGLDKAAMTNLIRQHSALDLVAAKQCAEAVLEGDEVVLWVRDSAAAQVLAAKLVECGALASTGGKEQLPS